MKEKREWKLPNVRWNGSLVLALLIVACILWELVRKLNFENGSDIYGWFRLIHVLLAGAVLSRIRFKGNGWYWLSVLGLVLILLTSAFRGMAVLNKTKNDLIRGCLLFILCPSLGLLLTGTSLKRVVKLLIALWTLCFAALAVAGVYSVLQGIKINDLSGKYFIGLKSDNLLRLLDVHYNTTAHNLSASLMIAVVGLALSEKGYAKALYALAMVPMFLCLALTGGRSGELSACLGFGVAAALLLGKWIQLRLQKRSLQLLATCGVILAVAVVGMVTISGVQKGFNYLITGGRANLLVPSARAEAAGDAEIEAASSEKMDEAEEEEPQVVVNEVQTVRERSFFQENFLSDRLLIWGKAFEILFANPRLLLTGTSVPMVMTEMKELGFNLGKAHMHNILIQILVETGIWGLLLVGAFLFFLIRAAWRLFLDEGRLAWERLIFLPALIPLVMDMMEALLRVESVGRGNLALMVFAGLTLVLAGSAPAAGGAKVAERTRRGKAGK